MTKKFSEKKFWFVLFIIFVSLFSLAFISEITFSRFYIASTPFKELPYRDDFSVTISQSDLKMLNDLYLERKEEYFFCLVGRQQDNTFVVERLEEPEIKEADEFMVITEDEICCQSKKYIGTLHKHPKLSFFDRFIIKRRPSTPSLQDIYSFGETRKPLHIIQYGKDNFNAMLFFPDKLLNQKPVKVAVQLR